MLHGAHARQMSGNSLLKECAALAGPSRLCSFNTRPFSTLGSRHAVSSRHALRPRAAHAPHDKTVPNLYGIPVPVASAAKQRVALQRNASHEGDAADRFDDARAAVKSRMDTLKRIAAGIAISAALFTGPALAADVAKVGKCLLGNCQVVLAKCMADGECLENLICLQLCNGRPDETGCQIRCGDLYADKAVEAFTACAVSDKKCVPQRVDESTYPVPPPCALDEKFDLNNFQGRWYITAGLNPLFDIFDCQEHFFGVPEPGKLYGKINWRIPKGNRDFIERSTVQTFDQKLDVSPAYLRNDGNKYLNYTDDWYVLAQKPDEYAVIYYRGNNDAWKGYGGATIYTRASELPVQYILEISEAVKKVGLKWEDFKVKDDTCLVPIGYRPQWYLGWCRASKLPEQYIPEISEAVKKVGLKWEDFKVTDNTCGPHPPQESLAQEIEEDLQKEVKQVEYALEGDLKSFGRGFTVLEKDLVQELSKEEQFIQKEIQDAEDFVNRIERQYKLPPWLRWLYNLGFPMPDMPGMPGMTAPNSAAGNTSPAPGPPPAGSA